MRRFRRRRRRAAALALLPLTVLSTNALAADDAPRKAQIDASTRTVEVGDPVTLRGEFPGAAKASVTILRRAKGSRSWRAAGRTTTGASGRYRVRVKPRRSGFWRAEIAAAPLAQSAGSAGPPPSSGALDRDTGSERITVRSLTKTKVKGRNGLLGKRVEVAGSVTPAGASRRVVVRIGKRKQVTRTNRGGRFAVSWKSSATGTYPVRVRAAGNRFARGSSDRAGRVSVFRGAAASWYGPGLYGNALACGGRLTTATKGVAHKTLPCGTRVTLRYRNKQVTVPVVDRGPYAGNREYDLTSATRQALGFPDVGTVLTTR